MSVGSGGQGAVPPWIFIHDTDELEGGLMVLFFGLVFFFIALPPGNFLPTPLPAATICVDPWGEGGLVPQ